ncbi:MAG TPA: GNAT family N-acetyltransferase [Pyrinomonadaceae bacterium]|nr:GNAT family N-acetyltransferase [Pyrinomonadaceae bacterium]HMP65906.1 GNAT family N-acetyltransferase [Pyrinomonadaceae bacterium]
MIYSDIDLSRKLERTEALANADFVETRASLDPETRACWIEVGGAYAMFDGIESPLTQTFGLGMFEDAKSEHLDEIEAFFRKRDAPVYHEVSPMADPSILGLLGERGYRPIELTNVMFQKLDTSAPALNRMNPDIVSRAINPDEADLWASVASEGWTTEPPMLGEFMLNFGKIAARTAGGHPFIAELDGRPIAAGGLSIYDDICILAGAATVPDSRRRGAQNALLAARLAFAAERGCRLAMMCRTREPISKKCSKERISDSVHPN